MTGKLMKLFNKKPQWFRGGIVGVCICILLFVFYVGIYFPLVDMLTNCNENTLSSYCQGPPAWTNAVPMMTGHFFPIYSHFIIEGSSVTKMFCEYTEINCVEWTINQGCVTSEYGPTETCRSAVEWTGFIGMTLLLLAIYFAIGAGIGWLKRT
jgi:hypothetical protein